MADGPISSGSGSPEDPWQLKTPPLSCAYTIHREVKDGVDVEHNARGIRMRAI